MTVELSKRIRKLDTVTINRIAAGEIIHGPVNAIKELIENSIDAKATNIQIQCTNGGLKQFQIKDNGTGINKDDLMIVCERFTTSKITKYSDLKQINSFGFRGEALASITFVGHLQIITRTSDSQVAYKTCYSLSKAISDPTPIAANVGTSILVQDLFYNLPTRLKSFKASEEYMKIVSLVQKYAIHYHKIAFQCKQKSMNVQTCSNPDPLDTISLIYGNSLKAQLIKISHNSDWSLNGYISNSMYNQKKEFILFINNRLVDLPQLKKAIDSIYQKYCKSSFIYIALQLNSESVDVNVHPTKSIVCFLNQDSIINEIGELIELKLKENNESRIFTVQKDVNKTPINKTAAYNLVRTDSRTRTIDSFVDITPTGKVLKRSKSIVSSPSTELENSSFVQCASHKENTVRKDYSPIQKPIHKENRPSSSLNENTLQECSASNQKASFNQSTAKIPIAKQALTFIQSTPSKEKGHSCKDESFDSPIRGMFDSEVQIINPIEMSETTKNPNETPETSNEKLYELSQDSPNSVIQSITKMTEQDFGDQSSNDKEWIDVQLDSIQTLISNLTENENKGINVLKIAISQIFQDHTFVGIYNAQLSLIQHQTSLILVNHQLLSKALWYQFLLYGFSNFGIFYFETPLNMQELLALYTNDDTQINQCITILSNNRMMMREYFSIIINSQSEIVGIPIIIQDYIPNLNKLPIFLYNLSSVTFETELECFHQIAQAIADFYSIECFTDQDEDYLKNIVYSMSRKCLGQEIWADTNIFKQITCLSELYKKFERC